MLKFLATDKSDGTTLVGLVLSSTNIEKLKSDLAIEVDLRDMGIEQSIRVRIQYGGTDDELIEIAKHLKIAYPEAKRNIQRKHHEG